MGKQKVKFNNRKGKYQVSRFQRFVGGGKLAVRAINRGAVYAYRAEPHVTRVYNNAADVLGYGIGDIRAPVFEGLFPERRQEPERKRKRQKQHRPITIRIERY